MIGAIMVELDARRLLQIRLIGAKKRALRLSRPLLPS
jgi:hypothetical protein